MGEGKWKKAKFASKFLFMPYNIEELLALPEEERIIIVQQLLDSISEDIEGVETDEEEAAFVEERLRQHRANPNEGKSLEEFKKYFSEKYGL